MTERVWGMSQRECDYLEVIHKVTGKVLRQKEGAEQLGLSTRQLRRLQRLYQAHGAEGLVSKHRGKVSNNRLRLALRSSVLELMRTRYQGFGPTFAHEYLTERDGLKLSVESLRKLMVAEGLWRGKLRKAVTVHQQRERRDCFGELVQIDGSPHDWFEGRAPKCCLLVFIDDATSQILWLHFVEEETTEAYFTALKGYLSLYGRPLEFYSDRDSIFRVNAPESASGSGHTQFSRVMRELDIKLTCANSPQAKGRVERANQTMQDRLVKALRLEKISDIQTANAFLSEFRKDHNKRFAVTAASTVDAHRKKIPEPHVLTLMLSHQCFRTVSKNLEISYHNVIYQIQLNNPGHRLRNALITVCDHQGEITLLYNQKALAYKIFDKKNQPTQITPAKQINSLKKARTYKPRPDHPWKGNYPLPPKIFDAVSTSL